MRPEDSKTNIADIQMAMGNWVDSCNYRLSMADVGLESTSDLSVLLHYTFLERHFTCKNKYDVESMIYSSLSWRITLNIQGSSHSTLTQKIPMGLSGKQRKCIAVCATRCLILLSQQFSRYPSQCKPLPLTPNSQTDAQTPCWKMQWLEKRCARGSQSRHGEIC